MPTNIQTYEKKSVCKNEKVSVGEATRYSLIQTIRTREVKARTCQVMCTALQIYCGVYGHNKITTMKVEVPLDLSALECITLYQRGAYISPDGRPYPVRINEETVVCAVETGEIITSATGVECVGEDAHIQGHNIPRMFTIS